MIENPGAKMKKLLDDYRNKQITLEQLDTECAYWYLDCFDEIFPKSLPTVPNRLLEYYNSDQAMQQKTPKEFWLLPEVKNYLDQKELIVYENTDSLYNLKRHLSNIPDSDFVSKQKFKEKIMEFESKDFS